MKQYTLIPGKTGLLYMPYKVTMSGIAPVDVLVGIKSWLVSNNVKYEYNVGPEWYFKHNDDAIAFILKWS